MKRRLPALMIAALAFCGASGVLAYFTANIETSLPRLEMLQMVFLEATARSAFAQIVIMTLVLGSIVLACMASRNAVSRYLNITAGLVAIIGLLAALETLVWLFRSYRDINPSIENVSELVGPIYAVAAMQLTLGLLYALVVLVVARLRRAERRAAP